MQTAAEPTQEPPLILFWTHAQCAAHLGISTRQLLNWRKSGVLPAACWWKPTGGDVVYRQAKVIAWANGDLAEPSRGRRA